MRWMKKRYKKNKEYSYKHYWLGFPARLNEQIEPHRTKDFEIADFAYKQTAEQEVINITLIRNKCPK
jgi:hypothetical protein